ncbi:ribonuclease HII [Flavobacteriaceae bacterium S0825]|uniref:ribonuclease HII n=1 Tax=Gaetbulibacter sp. S0825 TaxID=2720084 RepID=UPI0014304958|nr:ribonuclease HII [Gaetbulibacter sp. S0825]MCK0107664.1 ribonuclease HII [Flavobacteriaceae bacterium S0825]NIX63300.1 ribonuclease HII [Gaetbulibacter sp. S0825]
MKKFFVSLIILSICFSCNNSRGNKTSITQLIPDSTSVILKINTLETFKSDIKNSAFIKGLSSTDFYENFNSSLESLESFNTNNEILVCYNNSGDSLNYTFITKYHDSLLQKNDSLKLYNTILDSVFVASNSNSIITNLSVQKSNSFNTFSKALSTDKSFSLLLNNKSVNNFGKGAFGLPNNNFANTIAFDAEITPDQLILNGVSINNDSVRKFIDVFKNTIPQENTIQNITPLTSDGFLSFTYNDFQTLHQNLATYKKQIVDSTQHFELLETLTEVGLIYLDDKKVLALKSIDAFSTNAILNSEENKTGSFRNTDIFSFNSPSYFKNIFAPIVSFKDALKYINIDDFFVFANDEELLKTIITNIQNGSTYNTDTNYSNLQKSLSDEASLLVIANSKQLESILESTFNETAISLNLSNHKFSGFQIVQDDGFVHINTAIKKNKSRRQQNTISEEFNVSLESDILTNPQFVINHRTKQKDIVVQDINNNLYLISNKGKVLWKKQLQGTILGSIAQVDLYKNGRLQLAFATPNRVYILDRNGKDVSPFPLKFNNEITQPLSVFDYDNNKNYRFIVAQNNVLIMYNKNGKRVNGFKYQNTSNDILTQPKHFRINNRDYIVFAAGKTLKVLNRRGQSRINVNENIDFSGNDIYKYNDVFTTTTKSGELVQINLSGAVSKQALNLSSNHYITTTSKTLASVDENKLTIKQRTQELDFGNYTAPKIFYINDKIYITLTDLQAQKIYMFDSQSKPINNFPVYGTSIIDFANIDGDSNLEFVTKGESNSIIIYQKN